MWTLQTEKYKSFDSKIKNKATKCAFNEIAASNDRKSFWSVLEISSTLQFLRLVRNCQVVLEPKRPKKEVGSHSKSLLVRDLSNRTAKLNSLIAI